MAVSIQYNRPHWPICGNLLRNVMNIVIIGSILYMISPEIIIFYRNIYLYYMNDICGNCENIILDAL